MTSIVPLQGFLNAIIYSKKYEPMLNLLAQYFPCCCPNGGPFRSMFTTSNSNNGPVIRSLRPATSVVLPDGNSTTSVVVAVVDHGHHHRYRDRLPSKASGPEDNELDEEEKEDSDNDDTSESINVAAVEEDVQVIVENAERNHGTNDNNTDHPKRTETLEVPTTTNNNDDKNDHYISKQQGLGWSVDVDSSSNGNSCQGHDSTSSAQTETA
jgi:hypothetical protein